VAGPIDIGIAGLVFTDIAGIFVTARTEDRPVDFVSLNVVGTTPGQAQPWVAKIFGLDAERS
jgi:hypothetical protein